MADFDPALRPLEASPLAPLRERPRRKDGHEFDLQRELAGRRSPEAREEAPDQTPHEETGEAPVAPRAEDEAGGQLDVTA